MYIISQHYSIPTWYDVLCEHSAVQSEDAVSTVPHTNIVIIFRQIIFVINE
jgi:hypothetical protein